MKQSEIEELEKLCEAATPGPWRFSPGPGFGRVLYDGRGYLFGQIDDNGNGEFIAVTRTAVPKLIARVRELEEQVESYRNEPLSDLAHKEIMRLQQQVAALEEQKRAREFYVRDLQLDNESFKEEIITLRSEVDTLEQQVTELHEQVQSW